MSLSENIKTKLHSFFTGKRWEFFQTIRFKLTLLNSALFFIFFGTMILLLNVYMNRYLRADPDFGPNRGGMIMVQQYDDFPQFQFNQLQMEERARIQEIRLYDLRQIQVLSLFSLLPIALICFALGYIVSGKYLSPLGQLKSEIDLLKARSLGKTIPVEVEDEVGGLIMSFNDMSVRLKEAFSSQERFVQDAAHELKTPLTVIQTNLDTVLDDEKASPDELKLAINNALKGMKDLRNLTDYLLELSINRKILITKVNLNDLVKKQADSLKDYARKQQVGLATTLPREKILLEGDELALGRAMFNLIENAVKYSQPAAAATENPGTLAKHMQPQVRVSLEKARNSAVFKVQDNGQGISAEDQRKIFDRFYRVDKSRNRKSGGFGLGLAIAKKVADEHHGKINVVSKPGNTVFTIELPLLK